MPVCDENPRLGKRPGFSSLHLQELILPNPAAPEPAYGDDTRSPQISLLHLAPGIEDAGVFRPFFHSIPVQLGKAIGILRQLGRPAIVTPIVGRVDMNAEAGSEIACGDSLLLFRIEK